MDGNPVLEPASSYQLKDQYHNSNDYYYMNKPAAGTEAADSDAERP